MWHSVEAQVVDIGRGNDQPRSEGTGLIHRQLALAMSTASEVMVADRIETADQPRLLNREA